jgi:hypothetical protein
MVNNDYIAELTLDIDADYIKNLPATTKGNLKSHQHLVSDNNYLTAIQKKYPFLGDIYNIYVFPPKGSLPIHIDSNRQCAINIPIYNTVDSETIFYKLEEPVKTTHVTERVYDVVKSKVSESFKFTLTYPTLINNKVPHSAINYSNSNRILLSWGLNSDINFATAKELLNEYIL